MVLLPSAQHATGTALGKRLLNWGIIFSKICWNWACPIASRGFDVLGLLLFSWIPLNIYIFEFMFSCIFGLCSTHNRNRQNEIMSKFTSITSLSSEPQNILLA